MNSIHLSCANFEEISANLVLKLYVISSCDEYALKITRGLAYFLKYHCIFSPTSHQTPLFISSSGIGSESKY